MRRIRLISPVTLCLIFLLVTAVDAEENEDVDRRTTAAIIFVTTPVLVFMLLISLFGHRIRSTAIRFHVINISMWGLLHMVHCSAFPAERAPFHNWFRSKEWKNNQEVISSMTRSVFPTGLIVLLLEQIIVICAPKLANFWCFNLFFAIFLLGFVNISSFVLYNSQYWGIEIWFNLVKFYNVWITVIHMIAMPVYFIFCLFGSIFCCVSLGRKQSARRPSLFVGMWLLFLYGMVAAIIEGPPLIPNAMELFLESVNINDLIIMLMEMMKGDGEGGSSIPSFITMDLIFAIMDWVFGSEAWLVVLFPLINAVMTIVCFTPYREQFFFFVSCGKLFNERVPHWERGGKRKVVVAVPHNLPAPVQTATYVTHPPIYTTAPVAYANGAYPIQNGAVPLKVTEFPGEPSADLSGAFAVQAKPVEVVPSEDLVKIFPDQAKPIAAEAYPLHAPPIKAEIDPELAKEIETNYRTTGMH